MASLQNPVWAESWEATYYCRDFACTGKQPGNPAYGITASGRKATAGRTVAVNWLPFGTRLKIDGKLYAVEDRGAVSHFGSKNRPKKRVDIFMESHEEALKFGRRTVEVRILRAER